MNKLITHKHKSSILSDINAKDIPVEWELMKTIYKDENWMGFYNCNQVGSMFLYTHPKINGTDRNLTRLMNYIDSYHFTIIENLDKFGSSNCMKTSAEIFSTCNFHEGNLSVDFAVFHGRTYLVNKYSLDIKPCQWIDHKGKLHNSNALPRIVLVYIRSVDSDITDLLSYNLTLMRTTSKNLLILPPIFSKHRHASCEREILLSQDKLVPTLRHDWGTDIDEYVTICKIKNKPEYKYSRFFKYLTRLLLNVGKVWGLEPFKIIEDRVRIVDLTNTANANN